MNPKKLVRKGTIALVKEGEIEKIESLEELNKLYQLKVREELEEILMSKHNDVNEFADLISVVTAYARINGYDSKMLQKAVEQKIISKGGFSDLALNNLNPENPSNRLYFEKDQLVQEVKELLAYMRIHDSIDEEEGHQIVSRVENAVSNK